MDKVNIFFLKNAVLSWEWTRVIVRIRSCRGMPRFQELSNSKVTFVDDGAVIRTQ